MSVNRACILGYLGRDPEVRTTQSGTKIANLSVATSEAWTDRNSGERKERTEWHKVVIFNERVAEFAEKYLTKGARVYLEGSLSTRKWTDQGGVDRFTTEIVISQYRGELVSLEAPKGVHTEGNGHAEQRTSAPPPPKGKRGSMSDYWKPQGAPPPARDDLDDAIPFAPCWQ
jgi:single-strand DNA-binding protein